MQHQSSALCTSTSDSTVTHENWEMKYKHINSSNGSFSHYHNNFNAVLSHLSSFPLYVSYPFVLNFSYFQRAHMSSTALPAKHSYSHQQSCHRIEVCAIRSVDNSEENFFAEKPCNRPGHGLCHTA